MTVLNKYENTIEAVGEFGGKVVTNSIVTVFDTIESLRERVETARPMYLKHAHPRNGKVRELSSKESHTFIFDHTDDNGDTKVHVRVYRLEEPDEEAERLYKEVENSI